MMRLALLTAQLLVWLAPANGAALATRVALDARRAHQFENLARQSANGVLLVDGDNVRGKASFAFSHASLLARLSRWAARRGLGDRVVLLVDHGARPSAFHLPSLGSSVVFSGPSLSADDVAARDVGWLQARGHDVMLVTADSGLAQRCRSAGRGHGRTLTIVPPQTLLTALGHAERPPPSSEPHKRPSPAVSSRSGGRRAPKWDSREERLLAADDVAARADDVAARADDVAVAADDVAVEEVMPADVPFTHAQLGALENEMRARAGVTRAERAIYRVAKNAKKAKAAQRVKTERAAELSLAEAASAAAGAPLLHQIVTPVGEGQSLDASQQEATMAELVSRRQRRPPSEQWTEHTFERVVLAEVLRRRLERRQVEGRLAGGSNSGPAAAYAAMVRGDIVPPVATGGAAVIGRGAMDGGARDACAPLALVSGRSGERDGLDESSPDLGTIEYLPIGGAGGGGAGSGEGGAGGGARLIVRSLVVRFRDASRPIVGARDGGKGKSRRDRKRLRRHEMQSLGEAIQRGRHKRSKASSRPAVEHSRAAEAQAAEAAEEAKTAARDVEAAAEEAAAREVAARRVGSFVRLVVISDTHGHESSLAPGRATGDVGGEGADELSASSLLLPDADVLVHCGDWFGGRRRDGSSDTGAARLDAWLSKQPQKHKLVIRGNHDPVTASFPLSRALYVTSPSSVRLGGLTFACVPYTKGPLRGALPIGDILVSHVPPKRILDRTSSGEDAGDESLRTAVKRARDKPRLWLFGHIHEASGACRVRFGARAEPATTLVNAACANPGAARKMVAGPVVLDLEVAAAEAQGS